MKAPRPNRGTALIVVAVIGIWLYLQDAEYHDADHRTEWSEAQELEAAQQDAAALATWQDDKTLVCTPKRGQPYRVAERRSHALPHRQISNELRPGSQGAQ